MNFDIRQAIIDNISTNSNEHLESVVVDAMQTKEEKMLPGLGVLFELIWEHSDSENKQTMIDSLQNSLKERNSH
ncbi:MAG TPA: small acid-soluble spore protein SspI [Candidatus Avamphibacillus intestinigallinarum]|nr:small acid-soluble spore protein SspI [Candidatus Avamphibacillus intestinigallinarum]